ncbi:hypothetical protein O9929_09570 [Vibrio lentus]|nr:hypothetical protein [Vibrio lentus]
MLLQSEGNNPLLLVVLVVSTHQQRMHILILVTVLAWRFLAGVPMQDIEMCGPPNRYRWRRCLVTEGCRVEGGYLSSIKTATLHGTLCSEC